MKITEGRARARESESERCWESTESRCGSFHGWYVEYEREKSACAAPVMGQRRYFAPVTSLGENLGLLHFLPKRRKLGWRLSRSNLDWRPNRKKLGSPPEDFLPKRRKFGSPADFSKRTKLGSRLPRTINWSENGQIYVWTLKWNWER